MKSLLRFFFILLIAVGFTSSLSWGETNSQNVYVSPADQDLNIKSIVIVPAKDNVGGIYAKPIEELLHSLINNDKQWSLADFPASQKLPSEPLEEDASAVQKILKASDAEALLSCRLVKGPKGISISLTFFAGHEGLPLLQETLTDYKGFDIADVNSQVKKLFDMIKAKLPFRATILSRRGQQVTLNLGSIYGLKANTHVTVVQILKINRHPKLHFMVGTEKEVLGRVRLFKVEPYLSFGNVEFEKESGVIAVGAKVIPEEYLKYSTPVVGASGKVIMDMSERGDKDVAFGENPQEWKPETLPQYGKVEVMGGISTYSQNTKLQTAGALSGGSSIVPNLAVSGEFWLNPEWYVGFEMRQAIFQVNNPQSGSTPTKLNMGMAEYGVNFGYNLLLTDDFFGPKLQLSGGYATTIFSVDDSTPLSYTKMQYGGFLVGIAGQFPISDQIPVDLGAKLNYYISPGLTENISSGASSSNNIESFGFFADYKLRTRFKIRGEMLFDYYSSNFSGTGERTDPASSTSHRLTTLMAGIQYLF